MIQCVVLLITAAVAVVAGGAIKSHGNWRIIDGESANVGQFPYQVSLRVSYPYNMHCGGSLIDATTILTAAHCILDLNPELYTVVVGSNQLDKGGDKYKVIAVRPHERYYRNPLIVLNDIAIIKVNEKVKFGPTVQPIPMEFGIVDNGVACVVSGFGYLSAGGPASNNLQYLYSSTINYQQCKVKLFNIQEYNICTSNGIGRGPCNGDSGGPLVANGKLIGIVSFAGGGCAVGNPDVYTGLSHFATWIQKNRY